MRAAVNQHAQRLPGHATLPMPESRVKRRISIVDPDIVAA
jgi:hypothetical protein